MVKIEVPEKGGNHPKVVYIPSNYLGACLFLPLTVFFGGGGVPYIYIQTQTSTHYEI